MGTVHWTEEQGIGTVTIDVPPVNVLNESVLRQLNRIVERITDSCRVVILTGAGEKAFVAGADINEFPTLDRESGMALSRRGQRIMQRIEELKQPVIAAIDGYALGGGLELALACDLRVATRRSQLGLPEVTLGIIPGYGGTQRLARLIGPSRAKRLIYTGTFMSADEAYRIGLIDALVDDDALTEAKNWAQLIMKQAPLAVQAAKKAINEGFERSLADGLQLEAELFGDICTTEDKQEGIRAFFAKQEPSFSGK